MMQRSTGMHQKILDCFTDLHISQHYDYTFTQTGLSQGGVSSSIPYIPPEIDVEVEAEEEYEDDELEEEDDITQIPLQVNTHIFFDDEDNSNFDNEEGGVTQEMDVGPSQGRGRGRGKGRGGKKKRKWPPAFI